MNKKTLAIAVLAITSTGCIETYHRPYRVRSTTYHTPSPIRRHTSTPRYAPSAHTPPRGTSHGFNPHSSKYNNADRRKMENYQNNRDFEANRRRAQEHFRRLGH